MSNQLIIDISNSIFQQGVIFNISKQFALDDSVLPYIGAEFVGQLTLDIDYRCIDMEIDIVGEIAFCYTGLCDRCTEKVSRDVVVDIEETFVPTVHQAEDYVYSGNKLDLTQAVIDNILSVLPSTLLCSEQCKGLCPVCGTNLTVSQCDCTKIQ